MTSSPDCAPSRAKRRRERPPCCSQPELFFAEEPARLDAAKSLCATCRIRPSCLAEAIARREPAGVWGGQIFVHGQIVAYKRARGRPRKGGPRVLPEASEVQQLPQTEFRASA